MADILGSVARGYQRGQAQYAANEKARADAAEKARKAAMEDAKFQLEVANSSRLATAQAEEAANKIMSTITDEKWDSALIPSVRNDAMRFDATYGKIWAGGSMLRKVEEALHLGSVKDPGALDKGQVGPQVEVPDQKHPLWGFVSPEQKEAADVRAQDALTRQYSNDLQVDALNYMDKHAKVGGHLDPDLAWSSILEWQASVMSQNDFNPKVVMDITQNLLNNMKDVFAMRASAAGVGDAYAKANDALSKDISSWLKSMIGTPNGMGDFSFDESQQALMVKAEQIAQGLVGTDLNLHQIKMQVSKMLFDPATGAWQKGGKEIPIYMAALGDAPPQFALNVDNKYRAGLDPAVWEPVWNPSTRVGTLANKTDGTEMIVYPVEGPDMTGVVEEWSPKGAPSRPAPGAPAKANPEGRAMLPGMAADRATKAAASERQAAMARTFQATTDSIQAAKDKRKATEDAVRAELADSAGWARSNISESMSPDQVEASVLKRIQEIIAASGPSIAGGSEARAKELYRRAVSRVSAGDTYQKTVENVLDYALAQTGRKK